MHEIDLNPFHKNNHYMTAIAMCISLGSLLTIALLGYFKFPCISSEFIKLPWEIITFIIIFLYSFLFLFVYLMGCLVIYIIKKLRKWSRKNKIKLRAFVYNPLKKSKENIKNWDEYEKLYNSEFTEASDATTADTKKWLLNTRINKKIKKGEDLDYLILAKSRSKVCGFLKICYYYNSDSFAYISYLLKKDNEKDNILIVPEMSKVFNKMLKKQLRGCTGIVADTGKNDKSLIRLFQQKSMDFIKGSTLWNLDEFKLDYELPCHDANDENKSDTKKPTILLYVRTHKNNKFLLKEHPDSAEIKQILQFVYKIVYGNCFPEDKDKNEKYNKYVGVIHDRVLQNYENKLKGTSKNSLFS